MNRRRFLGALTVSAVAVPVVIRAQDLEMTPEPGDDFSATPSPDLPKFGGRIDSLWTNPAALENQLVEFSGTILQLFEGDKGEHFTVGTRELRFRSIVVLNVSGGYGSALVGYNGDLSALEGYFTARVVGRYVGINDDQWDRPVVAALELTPPKVATPQAG